ncbi:tape measure protein [Bifidobacterium longum]|uniref:tape measure protein n=1 Tax=Bifidobacterium longum TaxID=216816 RepID=UPI00319E8AD2
MARIVGTGAVRVFPVMTGFKKSVSQEMSGSGSQGAKKFTDSLKGMGSKAGKQLGKEFGTTAKDAMKNVGGDEMKQLSKDVASAAAAVSKARIKQQTATASAIQAENTYNAAVKKYGADSTQAAAAEQRLAAARERVKLADIELTAATGNLKSAQEALTTAQKSAETQAKALAESNKSIFAKFKAGFSDIDAGKASTASLSTALGSLAGAIAGPAVNAINKFRAGWTNANMAMLDGAGWLGKVGGAARTVADGIGKITAPFKTAGAVVKQFGSDIAYGLGQRFNSVKATVSDLAAKIPAPFRNAASTVVKGFSSVGNYLGGIGSAAKAVFGKLAPIAQGAAKGVGNAFLTAFQGIASKASSAMGAVGNALKGVGNAVKGIATGAVTVGIAGIGTALTAGFSRLNAIDTASAKLRGLGNDAKSVDAIMANATASVKGTSFGLGEAATVAASAVAAGIKPGEQLETMLKGVANVAAATGGTMEETGSVFNKVAATGKAYTDNINQLSDRGLPIWQALADKLGVTTDEVREMASKGKIDFQTFSDAAASAAGTVATEMGTTVPGAFANLKASIGRIGANLLDGVFGKLGPLIQAATKALGPMEDMAKGLGSAIGDVLGPAIDRVTGWLTKLGEGAGGITGKLSGMSGVIAPVAAAFGALGLGGVGPLLTKIPILGEAFGGLANSLGLIGGPVGVAVAALGGLIATTPRLKSAFGAQLSALFQNLKNTLSGMGPAFETFKKTLSLAFKDVGPSLIGSLESVINSVGAIFQQLIGVIPQIVEPLLTGFGQMAPAIGQTLTAIASAISEVMALLVPLVPQIITPLMQVFSSLIPPITTLITSLLPPLASIIQALMPVITTVMNVIGQVASIIVNLVSTVLPPLLDVVNALIQPILSMITTLLPPLNAVIQALIPIIMQIVAALAEIIAPIGQIVAQIAGAVMPIIQQLGSIVQSVANLVAWAINSLLLPAFSAMAPAVTSAVGTVKAVFSTISGIISGIVNVVSGIISGNWGQVWNGFKQIVSSAVKGLGSIVGGIRDTVLNALSGAGQWLVQSGKAIIDGLISGIKGAISGAKDAVSGALQSIRDLFPFSPAKEGPFSGRGWVLYSGRSITAAFAQGVTDNAGKAEKAVHDAMQRAQSAANGVELAYRSTIGRTDTATAGYGGDQRTNVTNITQNITTVQDDPRKQALAWGRYAGKAFAGTGGV